MRALAAVQSQDTAHHMHSLLLSHGNEWNISFGRDQGAPIVKCELLQLGATPSFPNAAEDTHTTHKDACFGCSAITGHCSPHAFLAAFTWQ